MLKKSIFSVSSLFLSALVLISCSTPVTKKEPLKQISVSSKEKPMYGLGGKIGGASKLTIGEKPTAFIPVNVDLRPGFAPVYNQGKSNACGGFAMAHGLSEYLLRKTGNQTPLSPRFVWNSARIKENTLKEDMGIYLKTLEDVALNVGVVPESDFPFPSPEQMQNDNIYNAFISEAPSSVLNKKAQSLKLAQGITKVTSLAGIKEALAKGAPVVSLIEIYASIFNTGANGNIPVPSPNSGDEDYGGHFILCVGYNEQKEQLIIRNSWGGKWGAQGYGYLPYAYVAAGYVYEGFTVKY